MFIEEAYAYIEGANGKNIVLGLQRIEYLMDQLGRPDKSLKIIHVTGTNGKGSTCEMISCMLMAAGYKVGSFNSPYFDSPCECMRINGKNISEKLLLDTLNEMEPILKALKEEEMPSGFEILTATALKLFADEKVDFVLLEVGLGGRLDATNVIKQPMMCVFTKIALDHMNLLGETIEAITLEKAGIIKEGAYVISGLQEKGVIEKLMQKSKSLSATFSYLADEEIKDIKVTSDGTSFCFKDKYYKVPLIGRHQAYNGSLALHVIESLKEAGVIQIEEEQMQNGLQEVKWPGRFEKVNSEPEIYLDGAHNLDGMKALNETLKALQPAYTIGVMGVLKDKAYDEMLACMSGQINELIVTKPEHVRALDEKVLAQEAGHYFAICQHVEKVEDALQQAISRSKAINGKVRIICFGSLYMIAAIRKKLFEKE